MRWDEVEHLANNKPFYLIADVSESAPPKLEVRSLVKDRYNKIESAILFMYICVGDKILLWIAVQFMTAAARTKKFKQTKSIPAGLEMIKNNN